MPAQQNLIDNAVAWAYGEDARPAHLQKLFEDLVPESDFEICFTLKDLDLCASSAADLLETTRSDLTSADKVVYAQARTLQVTCGFGRRPYVGSEMEDETSYSTRLVLLDD